MFWNFCSINETPGPIYTVGVLSSYLQSFWVKVLHILGRPHAQWARDNSDVCFWVKIAKVIINWSGWKQLAQANRNSNSINSKNKWRNKQNQNKRERGKAYQTNERTIERGGSVNNVCKICTKSKKVLTYCVTKNFLPVCVNRCKYMPVIFSSRTLYPRWPRIRDRWPFV